MEALIFNKETKEISFIVKMVREVGVDYLIGDRELRGLNIDALDFIVIENELDVNVGDTLPEGLVDIKFSLVKATLDDFGRELAMEKMKNIQSESTIASLGMELSKVKMELISMKEAAL